MCKTITSWLKAICCTNVQVNEPICPGFSRKGSDAFERFGICLGRFEFIWIIPSVFHFHPKDDNSNSSHEPTLSHYKMAQPE